MEITNNSAYTIGNYDSTFRKNTTVKNDNATNVKNTAVKSDNATNNVEEYYEKLCKKFPQISFNTGGTCSANKVVVNISPKCLEKMANDPEFAKEIEWNLSGEVAANAQIHSWARRDGIEVYGRTVTYDANGKRESGYGMRTANPSNKKNGIFDLIQDKKSDKEDYLEKIREKRKEKEEYLERIREKRKEQEEYLEKIQENKNNGNEYKGEMLNNSISAVKAYNKTELDNVDLLSMLDTKI